MAFPTGDGKRKHQTIEERRVQRKKYYEEHKQECLERVRKWKAERPEYRGLYYIAHKEEELKCRRAWNKLNPEKVKRWRRDYCAKNKERIQRVGREWRREHAGHIYQRRRKKRLDWYSSFIGMPIENISCVRCGYNTSFSVLDFHHIDSNGKHGTRDTFGWWLNEGMKYFQDKVRSTDGVWLCANCHRELHIGIWNIADTNDRMSQLKVMI